MPSKKVILKLQCKLKFVVLGSYALLSSFQTMTSDSTFNEIKI